MLIKLNVMCAYCSTRFTVRMIRMSRHVKCPGCFKILVVSAYVRISKPKTEEVGKEKEEEKGGRSNKQRIGGKSMGDLKVFNFKGAFIDEASKINNWDWKALEVYQSKLKLM